MASSSTDISNKYCKLLSSLFCSSSIMALSILCLLNNLTLDLYSVCMLLKVVIPGSFCFWFIGYVMGKLLDRGSKQKRQKALTLTNDNEAYEIPSMFAGTENQESEESVDENVEV